MMSVYLKSCQKLVAHLFGIVAVMSGFVIALIAQWHGFGSVVAPDGAYYIVSGVNLITTGHFVNSFGYPETWFPPVYPFLIGAASLGGQFDPVFIGRLIAAVMGLVTVVLVWHCVRSRHGILPMMALASAICLACNSLHQWLSSGVMSETTATCFAFAAIVVWLSLDHFKRLHTARYVVIGLLFGLSTLTRPEAVIFLPLLALWDLAKKGFAATARQYLIAFAVMATVLLPYVIYLHNVTGKWTISDKTEVNIADGRAEFYQMPARFIDPDSLQLKYSAFPVSFSSEIHRYADNILKIGKAYLGLDIYRSPLAFALLLCAALGVRFLAIHDQQRFLFGLLVPFACLPIIAFFHVEPRYLHPGLPSLSVFIGIGLVYLIQHTTCRLSSLGIVQTIVLLAAVGCLIEGGTRQARWALSPPPSVSARALVRDAGRNFAALNLPRGVMYEMWGNVTYFFGGTVAYYAGQIRGRVTRDDLSTVVRFMKHHESGPIYLTISTEETHGLHDKNLEELLNAPHPPFEKVLELANSSGKVIIFRVN